MPLTKTVITDRYAESITTTFLKDDEFHKQKYVKNIMHKNKVKRFRKKYMLKCRMNKINVD